MLILFSGLDSIVLVVVFMVVLIGLLVIVLIMVSRLLVCGFMLIVWLNCWWCRFVWLWMLMLVVGFLISILLVVVMLSVNVSVFLIWLKVNFLEKKLWKLNINWCGSCVMLSRFSMCLVLGFSFSSWLLWVCMFRCFFSVFSWKFDGLFG